MSKKKYFKSAALDEEISVSDFESRGSGFVAYLSEDNHITRVERIKDKKLENVTYHSLWPAQSIVDMHQKEYPGVFFEIYAKDQPQQANSGYTDRRYYCKPTGELRFYVEDVFDKNGDIIREARYSKDGNFIGALEYEYDEHGDIVLTREIASNGDIISEEESL